MTTKSPHRDHYLREWRKHRGLTQEQLSERVGIEASAISKIEAGYKPLMQHRWKKFAEALGCKIPDLFEAPPSSERLPSAGKKKMIDSKPHADVEFPPGVSLVAEVDMRAGMGGGGLVDAENTMDGPNQISKDVIRNSWGVPDDYLRELGVKANGTFLFRVVGDSMTRPDGSGLHSGDLIMADTHDRKPSPPGIFALFDGMGTVVKRVEYVMNSDPPALNVISDNPVHAPMRFAVDEVAIIGRCVWYGRAL